MVKPISSLLPARASYRTLQGHRMQIWVGGGHVVALWQPPELEWGVCLSWALS